MVSQSIFVSTRGQCDHRISSYSMRILSRTTACETKQKHGDFPNSTGHEQKAMGRRHIPSHNSFEHDFLLKSWEISQFPRGYHITFTGNTNLSKMPEPGLLVAREIRFYGNQTEIGRVALAKTLKHSINQSINRDELYVNRPECRGNNQIYHIKSTPQ